MGVKSRVFEKPRFATQSVGRKAAQSPPGTPPGLVVLRARVAVFASRRARVWAATGTHFQFVRPGPLYHMLWSVPSRVAQ